MKVVSPVGVPRSGGPEMHHDPVSLTGRTLGVLWNGKRDADLVLRALAELVIDEYGMTDVLWFDKRELADGPGRAATEAIFAELARCAALVLTASGDCGSCTSWTIHDAAMLERRGVPAVAICTDVFEPMARVEVRSWGVPNLVVGIIPHPLVGRDAAWRSEQALGLMAEVRRRVGSRETAGSSASARA